jgi:hypothetical protein
VRAFVISDGTRTVAFAENETQGAFAAYKRGPFGLTETRMAVEAATGGALPATHIVIGSDHSHAGPDTTGAWGGLPDAYMNFLKDQTVGAIIDAWLAMQPAQLRTGTVDATELLHSQFSAPPNDKVDGRLRVLVAADPADARNVQTILINFAAHATVMGSANTLVSAEWPGVVAGKIEQALHVETAVVMVADVGRTQPRGEVGPTDPEKLESYSTQVAAKVLLAAGNLRAVRGHEIAAAQLFLREAYANELITFPLLGSLVSRNDQPPWVTGDSIGTVVSAIRVGDVLFAAVPGEGYPAILFELQERVRTAREHYIFGLANDQLGYLIAPQEGYAQVAAAFPDNDNAFFNVSPAIGDHVMCTLLKASREVGFALPDDPAKCAPYAGENNRLPF